MKRARHVLCALACAIAPIACRVERDLGKPPPAVAPAKRAPLTDGAVRLETRHKNDPKTGAPLREWTLAFAPGKPSVKHGKETIWYPGGVKQWEREYKNGQPYGAWRNFYASGRPRSEAFYGDPQVETQMTFWHADGKISMQGPARNGVRCGVWKIFYANGQLAETGSFANSLREGEWRAWSEDGAEAWLVTYRRNVRTARVPLPHDAIAPASTAVEERSDAPSASDAPTPHSDR